LLVDENWYRLFHPKVVSLVTTLNKEGKINAGTFAWLTPLSDSPPILLLAAWYESHTFKNISETKEFVVNITPKQLKKEVQICAKTFPEGVNELEEAGLSWFPSKTVKPPRVKECMAWVECVAREVVKKEEEYSFIIADVKCVEVKEECYRNFMPKKEVLLHLGGKDYSSIKV